MNRRFTLPLLFIAFTASQLAAQQIPKLPAETNPATLSAKSQKQLPDLPQAYVSISPDDLGDGLEVGTLDLPGAKEAIEALVADDKAGKYENLDSLLLWKDGKLIFEMYNRKGRVDAPHYTMSITKTLTSVVLARAIECGLLTVDDLEKPVIDFMPEIDRTKIKPGVETITLRDALFMRSGLRFDKKLTHAKIPRQQYFQKLFEATEPITPDSKKYKYTGSDPSMIMMIIDIKTEGKVKEFIATELAAKLGLTYNWSDQSCGIPKCGAGSNFTSRGLLKIGSTILRGGQYNGEQLLSADYVKLMMAPDKPQGYCYYFHNRGETIGGVGAGGQYMTLFPRLNLVMVATSRSKNIKASLNATKEHLLPLFKK